MTVTVKLQLAVLLEVSVAVHVTVVVPFGNAVPDGGLQATVTPGQLSLPLGVAKVTTAEHRPGAVLVITDEGQGPIVGDCVSLTVTVNEQFAELLDESLTVQLTVVGPFGKVEPDDGVHVGVPTPEQLSVAVAFE
jgi:hypothetical protein